MPSVQAGAKLMSLPIGIWARAAAVGSAVAWQVRSAATRPGATRTAVIVTIDAEIAPHTSDWRRHCGRFALDRDIYGLTTRGERGLRYQLDLLARHGLRAVVFVEALSAGVLGLDLTAEIVRLVRDGGHEVALHLHTEWLPYFPRPLLSDRFGRHLSDFSEGDQRRLIEHGLEFLTRAGADRIIALRAGNFGANLATLRAARQSGIAIDSSYSASHLRTCCGLPADPMLAQPVHLEGVLEVPVSWFRDGRARVRPAQLCACSLAELEHLLFEAWRRQWAVVTPLLHSFELVRRGPAERPQRVTRLHEHRLVRLCHFLAEHSEKFNSTTFAELDIDDIATTSGATRCVDSSLGRTLRRYAEQAVGRVW